MMDKGLNIEIRRGYVGLALAFANRPSLCNSVLSRFLIDGRESDRPREQIADNLAKRHRLPIDWPLVDDCFAWTASTSNHIVLGIDAEFPSLLRATINPPNVLYVRGDRTLLEHPQVAMVGSRKATQHGLANARDLAHTVGKAGFIITSGLALGIDGACHRAALDANVKTLAVLGCGLEVNYPKRHTELAATIAEHGALISEFAPWVAPRPFHFPQRNRIISGLSIAIIVIEATKKSGSLTTASHAADQGREVYAVPGSVRSAVAAGCNQLISEGAQIVFESQALLESLAQTQRLYYPHIEPRNIDHPVGFPSPAAISADVKNLGPADKQILSLLTSEPMGFDELVTLSGLTTSELSSILSALELAGLIRSLVGNAYELAV
ncbi:MAG: DNA-processing protein DprA [Gammaproteobacteria bacterium]